MTQLVTIDSARLDSITGGRGAGAGRAVVNGAKWAWQNVGAPILGGAAYEAASEWLRGRGGNQQQQPQQQPQPPSQGGQ